MNLLGSLISARLQPQPCAALPALLKSKLDLDHAAHQAAPSTLNLKPAPTEAQARAGNYPKGHWSMRGLDFSIENPENSHRRPEWAPLTAHYGYVRGTIGADGDQVDVFLKPGTPEDYDGPVFVIDAVNEDGGFDEHKVMIGWTAKDQAVRAYRANYPINWPQGEVTELTVDELKDWLSDGDTTAALSKGDVPGHEFHGNQWTGGGDVPAAPGTSPIKDGYVRLYHQTTEENVASILKTGITIDHAQGIEGPRAVYASEHGFYGDPTSRPTIEFQVPKDKWSDPFVLQDVAPSDIIAGHLPWHEQARYIESNPKVLAETLAGKNDWLLKNPEDDTSRAVVYVKQKHAGLGKGDVPGHEFHGNQWTEESSGEHPPQVGQHFIAYRLGNPAAPLENVNAGNAQGVAQHLARLEGDDGPANAQGHGRNITAYDVVLHQPLGAYTGFNSGRASDDTRTSAVGRVAARGSVAYSFPKGASYTARPIGAVPLAALHAALRQRGFASFDESGSVLGAEVIRDHFGHGLGKGDVAGHEFHGNQWTGSMGGGGEMKAMFSRIAEPDGGFTYSPKTGEPKSGYVLSIHPERSAAFDLGKVTFKDLVQYAAKNRDLLAQDGNHLGAWHDPTDHKVFLDVSRVVKTPEEARDLSIKYDQRAYFDLQTFKSVSVNADATSGGVVGPNKAHHEQAATALARRLLDRVVGRPVRKTDWEETLRRRVGGSQVVAVRKGDVEGHEFHGNQWTGGLAGSDRSASEQPSVPEYHVGHGDGPAPVSVVGVHYSRQPRTVLLSSMYGTGMRGGESARLRYADDARVRQRIYFYVNTGSGTRPEDGVGAVPHSVRLTNLYEPKSDNFAIWREGKGDANASEAAILKHGYDGYYVSDFGVKQGVAVLLGSHRVPVALGKMWTASASATSGITAYGNTRRTRRLAAIKRKKGMTT